MEDKFYINDTTMRRLCKCISTEAKNNKIIEFKGNINRGNLDTWKAKNNLLNAYTVINEILWYKETDSHVTIMSNLPFVLDDFSNKTLVSSFCEVKRIDLSGIDTSHCNNMCNLFSHKMVSDIIGLDTLDTSSCVNNSYMFFSSCGKLDVSKFNMSNVKCTRSMFNSYAGEIVGLENWDTSKIQTMDNMFANAKIHNEINISKWNISPEVSIEEMFRDASIKAVNMLSFNVNDETLLKIVESFKYFEYLYIRLNNRHLKICNNGKDNYEYYYM